MMDLPHDDSDVLLDDMGIGLGHTIDQACLKPRFEVEDNTVKRGALRKAHSPSNVMDVIANSTLKVPISVVQKKSEKWLYA